jgi:ribokinase
MNLFVVGSSNIDMVIYLPRIPSIGETILGGESQMIYGGKGANQAVAAKRSGADVGFITKLGNDAFATDYTAYLEKEGFSKQFILNDKNKPSGIAQILVSEKGENSIAVAPGSNMTLMPADLIQFLPELAQASYLLMQLEIPLSTVEYLAEYCANKGVKVILNPAPAQKLSDELLNNIWMITPNETEAELLTAIKISDDESATTAAKILYDKGVENVIITLGEKGCLLYNANGLATFPAFKVKAVDSTAAGDVFNGTLASALTRGKDIEEAILYGSTAAAISVTKKGAQPSIPQEDEIEAFRKNTGKF